MKASYLGAMGYSERHKFPATWPVAPAHYDPDVSVRSYQQGIEECVYAEEMGFEWVSFSEHHYSGRIATGAPAVMAASVAERCKKVKIAMLGHVLPLNNPVRVAEELGLLDNLTDGRVIIGFLRGTATEDQTYTIDPAEGRGRLMEGMDLVLKALTEPQPFGWEGRYYNFRTVAVWPRPVQQPLPPVIVATRSEDSAEYAARNRLGLGVSFVSAEQVAQLTDKYHQWCGEADWTPQPEDVVFRGNIYLAETDAKAGEWLERGRVAGAQRVAAAPTLNIAKAAQAARTGEQFDLRNAVAGGPSGDVASVASRMNFFGSPDTVVGQIKEYRDRCGVGVVDLFFQQPNVSHEEVMQQIDLFGREVLPRIQDL